MWATIAAAFRTLAETLGLIRRRNDLRNANDVKQGAIQRSEAGEQAKDIEAVARGDLEEMRRRASE